MRELFTRTAACLLLGAGAVALPSPEIGLPLQDEGQEEGTEPTPAQRALEALQETIDEEMDAFRELLQAAETDEEREKLYEEKYPDPAQHLPEYWKIVESYPGDPGVVQVLVTILRSSRDGDEKVRAVAIVIRDHADSRELSSALRMLLPSRSAVELLERARGNERERVRGYATFALAGLLRSQASLADRLTGMDEETRANYAGYYGEDLLRALEGADSKTLRAKSEALFEEVQANEAYAALEYRGDRKLGDKAGSELFEIRNLSVGCAAPDIVGEDIDGTDFNLSDYRGKVVFLDFWGNW